MKHKKNEPPKVLWLQFHGDVKRELLDTDHGEVADGDVTWCRDKIWDVDIRYVIDKRYLRKKK